MSDEWIEGFRSSLGALGEKARVSVLPDFFVDRFVRIESIDELTTLIKTKGQQGGGSLRGISQSEVKGGNAVNLAYSLGKLGIRVNLLAIAESLPAILLESTFRDMKEVELNVISGKSGLTIALEFIENGHAVNVMLSETGDIANFDGSKVAGETWESVASARIVSVVNWGANAKGTELCHRVYSIARKNKSLTFLDPADVVQYADNIPKLKREIFDNALLDVLSLNENELRIMSKVLSGYDFPRDYTDSELRRAVTLVSQDSQAVVDLHTISKSCTARANEFVDVPCHKVVQRTVTGAGDVWDAGDLVGYLLGWNPEKRLVFANALAGLYVSNSSAESPSLDEVFRFLSQVNKLY